MSEPCSRESRTLRSDYYSAAKKSAFSLNQRRKQRAMPRRPGERAQAMMCSVPCRISLRAPRAADCDSSKTPMIPGFLRRPWALSWVRAQLDTAAWMPACAAAKVASWDDLPCEIFFWITPCASRSAASTRDRIARIAQSDSQRRARPSELALA